MQHPRILQIGALPILAVCLVLVACGVTTTTTGSSGGPGSGTATGTTGSASSGASSAVACGPTSRPGSTAVSTGVVTPIARSTGVPWTTPTGPTAPPVLVPPVQGTVTPGQVTLSPDATHYGPCDRIAVKIANGLSTPISAADHRTSCSLITLEREVNGVWRQEPPCLLQTPTRLLTIPAGIVVLQVLSPGRDSLRGSGWVAGIYRASFTYLIGPAATSGGAPAVTSAPFTIG